MKYFWILFGVMFLLGSGLTYFGLMNEEISDVVAAWAFISLVLWLKFEIIKMEKRRYEHSRNG